MAITRGPCTGLASLCIPSVPSSSDVQPNPAYGCGKTALIEALTPGLIGTGLQVLIVTNDVVTTEDARHVQAALSGVLSADRILGVETGACPHTAVREDPSMNLAAVEEIEDRFPGSDVVLIESGGGQPHADLHPGAGRLLHLRDRCRGRRQDPPQGRPGISQPEILVINKTDLGVPPARKTCRQLRHTEAIPAVCALARWVAARGCDRTAAPGVGALRDEVPPRRPCDHVQAFLFPAAGGASVGSKAAENR